MSGLGTLSPFELLVLAMIAFELYWRWLDRRK
jgi:hypothetical protein